MTQSDSSTEYLSGLYRDSGFSPWKDYAAGFTSSFSQDSTNHPGWRGTLGDSDVGGPWFLTRYRSAVKPVVVDNNLVKGPVWAYHPWWWDASAALSNTVEEAKAFGTRAINVTLPNNPNVNISQTLGEVRMEGLPSIIGSDLLKDKARFLRGSGSEYLNVEFGWKPIISDLRKFAQSVKDSNEIISGFRAGSDKKLRRRFSSPPQYGERKQEGVVYLQPLVSIAMQSNATVYETSETREWFSGAFRYHVPMGDDLVSRMGRYSSYANKLLGLRLTPDLVWNLTPWSWAADWFADSGDVIQNISLLGSDSMAMQYGYSMRSTHRETTTSFEWEGVSGYFRTTEETKRRLPASPYGFNLTFDGFSDRQKAICIALGLTRL